MDVSTHLKTFVAVADSRGFSQAARTLHVAPSVVAKRIAQLEAHVGARLFDRNTRVVELTEAGEKLRGGAGVLVSSMESLLDSIGCDESNIEGHIRLMAPTTLTMLYLGDVFNKFLRENERITMDVALIDRSTNPAEAGFDLAISGRSASYDGVIDIALCSARPLLCAAPSYFVRRGSPSHPRDLMEHDCLVFNPSGLTWQFQSTRGAINVEVKPRLRADDNLTLARAAIDGLGIAPLPTYVVRDALAKGALVHTLDKYPLQENWFKVFVPKRRQRVARIAALIDYLLCELKGDFESKIDVL